jgi:hypothetical protein
MLGQVPPHGQETAFAEMTGGAPGTVAPKPQNGGRHFIQHNPERKEITTGIKWLSTDLFRRHVGHSSQRGAGTCERFHVAVNNPSYMRGVQGICDVNPKREELFKVDGMTADDVFEGLPVQKLHRYVGSAVMSADVINRADIRMI